VVLNIIKPSNTQINQKKLNQILKYALISNGITLSAQIRLNIMRSENPLRNFQNWQVVVEGIGNVEDLAGYDDQVYTKALSAALMVINKPQMIPEFIRNPAIQIAHDTYTVFSRIIFSPPPPIPVPGLNQIFNLRDAGDIEFSTRYADIPIQHNQNQVFNKFICVLTQKPIRYPVIILNNQKNHPMKLPIQFFERKAILPKLGKRETSVYPGTNEPIAFVQLREYITVRKLIEDEMRNLNIPIQ
jgi:hypothetical protein